VLPGRRHVVLTRDRGWSAPGADVVYDVGEALRMIGEAPASVIGGAEIFALFLPLATRIELTEILADVEGDTVMPDPRDAGSWREVGREDHPADGVRPAYRFVSLERA
jgi:dihydrofolate reductase